MPSPSFARYLLITLLLTCLLVPGCGGGSGSKSPDNSETPPVPVPPPTSDPAPAPPSFAIGGFKTIDESEWTPTAVNKVLNTFALGGHATDQQIVTWSQMHPVEAIQEMLTFAPHNLKLSPPAPGEVDRLDTRDTALAKLAEFWASNDPDNTMPDERRQRFDYTQTTGWIEHLWPTAVTVRGLNPFLHRLTYFEANQHLAVHLDSVPVTTIIRYYDDIAQAFSDGKRYDEVLAIAAGSAAIAQQYGHRLNRFRNGTCFCNEDFAREFYQLFFGIEGRDDAEYHETITIKNTAKALTDIRIQMDANNDPTPDVVYGTEEHPQGPLEMLGVMIDGTSAQERIAALSRIAIDHPESLATLPVVLVRGLADDALDAQGEAIVQTAWTSMADKDVLLFLRAYAVSELFHSESRVKYWSSIERRLLLTNKVSGSNQEIYQQIYSVTGHVSEGVETFRPVNNVFGDQTGIMASDSLDVFRQNFNQHTDRSFVIRRFEFENSDFSWRKDWRQIIAPHANDGYTVAHVADTLWRRLIADGGKHMGTLERAHLYALLGTNTGLAFALDPDNPDKVYTESDLVQADIAAQVTEFGNEIVEIDSANLDDVERASFRVGQAISFIAATPYAFYSEGK